MYWQIIHKVGMQAHFLLIQWLKMICVGVNSMISKLRLSMPSRMQIEHLVSKNGWRNGLEIIYEFCTQILSELSFSNSHKIKMKLSDLEMTRVAKRVIYALEAQLLKLTILKPLRSLVLGLRI